MQADANRLLSMRLDNIPQFPYKRKRSFHPFFSRFLFYPLLVFLSVTLSLFLVRLCQKYF